MLRSRVVRQLLFEVAGLRRSDPAVEAASEAASEQEQLDDERREIASARKRAIMIVVLDAVALAALVALRDPDRGLVVLSRSEEALFTIGVLIVAAHLGFRLAQLFVLRNLERAWDDVPK
jgi:hypothetical protein